MRLLFLIKLTFIFSQEFTFVFAKRKLNNIKCWKIEESIGLFDGLQNFKDILNTEIKTNFSYIDENSLKKIYISKVDIPRYIILSSGFFGAYLDSPLNKKPIYLTNIISLKGFDAFIFFIQCHSLEVYILTQNIFHEIFICLDYLQIDETLKNSYFYVNLIRSQVASKINFDTREIENLFLSLPNNFLIQNFLNLFSYLISSINAYNPINDIDCENFKLNSIKIQENQSTKNKTIILKDHDIVSIMENVENIWYRNIFRQFIYQLLSVQIKIYIMDFHLYKISKLKLFADLFKVKELHIEGYYSYIFASYLLNGLCKNTLITFFLCGSRITESISLNISKLKKLQCLFLISCTGICLGSMMRIVNQNLLRLKRLDFSRTNITEKEIRQIFHLHSVERIKMCGSNINQGTISLLRDCKFKSSLRYLNLANNILNGEDISVIFSFPNLYHLDITGCRLKNSQEIKPYIIACRNLKALYMTYVNLNKNILKTLNYFLSLEILSMYLVVYNGVIFDEVNTSLIAQTLIELDFGQKYRTLSDIQKISQMKNLKKLNLKLKENDLKDGKLFNFQNLKCLKVLNISLCNLNFLDFCKKIPFLFEKLEKLSVAKNVLSETDLNLLGKFQILNYLNLSNTGLKNCGIFILRNSLVSNTLEYFDFGENELSYNDFLAVKSFKRLKYIRLFDCKMPFRHFTDNDILFLKNKCSIESKNISYKNGYIIFKVK
ncbi:hypothetical protein CWI36_1238p0010 [Hamiltosporidium magnivora]|uniref:Leucine-rich repeat-containing protein n=1 Tax=Hamiltosporidium magnivora TaxID=148818 RepID=A0A4Q9L5M3_9MICR|nr:hypothetical protein CWI36_1238p0010 [Hamiltosporidium magnivora]